MSYQSLTRMRRALPFSLSINGGSIVTQANHTSETQRLSSNQQFVRTEPHNCALRGKHTRIRRTTQTVQMADRTRGCKSEWHVAVSRPNRPEPRLDNGHTVVGAEIRQPGRGRGVHGATPGRRGCDPIHLGGLTWDFFFCPSGEKKAGGKTTSFRKTRRNTSEWVSSSASGYPS